MCVNPTKSRLRWRKMLFLGEKRLALGRLGEKATRNVFRGGGAAVGWSRERWVGGVF